MCLSQVVLGLLRLLKGWLPPAPAPIQDELQAPNKITEFCCICFKPFLLKPLTRDLLEIHSFGSVSFLLKPLSFFFYPYPQTDKVKLGGKFYFPGD